MTYSLVISTLFENMNLQCISTRMFRLGQKLWFFYQWPWIGLPVNDFHQCQKTPSCHNLKSCGICSDNLIIAFSRTSNRSSDSIWSTKTSSGIKTRNTFIKYLFSEFKSIKKLINTTNNCSFTLSFTTSTKIFIFIELACTCTIR